LRLDRSTSVSSPWRPRTGTYFGVIVKPGLVLAYGLRGNAWRSNDGGRRWQQTSTGIDTGSPAARCCPMAGSRWSRRRPVAAEPRQRRQLRAGAPQRRRNRPSRDAGRRDSVALVGARGVRVQNIR